MSTHTNGHGARTSDARRAQGTSIGAWLRLAADGWLLGLLVLIIGIAAGPLITKLQSELYGARGTVVISGSRAFLAPADADKLTIVTETVRRLYEATGQQRTRDLFVQFASDDATRSRRRGISAAWVGSHVSTELVFNSSIVMISAKTPDARDATDLVRASYGAFLATMSGQLGGSRSLLSPTGTVPARAIPPGLTAATSSVTSEGRVAPSPRRNILLATNVGVIFAVLASLVAGLLRGRVWNADDIAHRLGVPLLGRLSADGARAKYLATALASLWLPGHAGRAQRIVVGGPIREPLLADIAEGLAHGLNRPGETQIIPVDIAANIDRSNPPGETQILPVSTLRAGARGPGLLVVGDVNVLVVRRGIRAKSLDALVPYGETIQPYAGVLVIER